MEVCLKQNIIQSRIFKVTLLSILWGLSFSAEATSSNSWNKPWEISNNVSSLVPDMFYSSDLQNEQIMPTAIKYSNSSKKRKYIIDNIIYPTLGNPALFVQHEKGYDEDTMSVVLRMDENVWSKVLRPLTLKENKKNDSPWLESYSIRKEIFSQLQVKLRSQSQRGTQALLSKKNLGFCSVYGTDSGETFFIQPSVVIRHRHPSELGVQDPFLKALDYDGDHEAPVGTALIPKATIELQFKKSDLLSVCPGFYDLEVTVPNLLHETQRNSVRIFKEVPNQGNYSVINISDTQITVEYKGHRNVALKAVSGNISENTFKIKTYDYLMTFIKFINQKIRERDPLYINAAFISFNGDLHNGGSPFTVDHKGVADIYNREAGEVYAALSQLTMPIFLTLGNHDGYVTMMSQFQKQILSIQENQELLGDFDPNYRFGMELGAQAAKKTLNLFNKNLSIDFLKEETAFFPGVTVPAGGKQLDLFNGRFLQGSEADYSTWRPIPYADGNAVLYDGFNHWRKTYGPLYSSFRFGNNYYLNLNTYDLRQHRRSGWGMYTVNYGGNISPFQMDWIQRQTQNAAAKGLDIVILAHHDPRGGHRGTDYPYLFDQVDFHGLDQSLVNFIKGEIYNPHFCQLPDLLKNNHFFVDCLHDGLQEWMRPDVNFDCDSKLKSPQDQQCITRRLTAGTYFSSLELVKIIAKNNNIRTVILGHTHSNTVEIKYNQTESTALIPTEIIYDEHQRKRMDEVVSFGILRNIPLLNYLEQFLVNMVNVIPNAVNGVYNPMELFFNFKNLDSANKDQRDINAEAKTKIQHENVWGYLTGSNKEITYINLEKMGFLKRTEVEMPAGKELVVLRVASGADLANQEVDNQPMTGFSIFKLNNHPTLKDKKTINSLVYYQIRLPSDQSTYSAESMNPRNKFYSLVGEFQLNRIKNLPPHRLEDLISESHIDFKRLK